MEQVPVSAGLACIASTPPALAHTRAHMYARARTCTHARKNGHTDGLCFRLELVLRLLGGGGWTPLAFDGCVPPQRHPLPRAPRLSPPTIKSTRRPPASAPPRCHRPARVCGAAGRTHARSIP